MVVQLTRNEISAPTTPSASIPSDRNLYIDIGVSLLVRVGAANYLRIDWPFFRNIPLTIFM